MAKVTAWPKDRRWWAQCCGKLTPPHGRPTWQPGSAAQPIPRATAPYLPLLHPNLRPWQKGCGITICRGRQGKGEMGRQAIYPEGDANSDSAGRRPRWEPSRKLRGGLTLPKARHPHPSPGASAAMRALLSLEGLGCLETPHPPGDPAPSTQGKVLAAHPAAQLPCDGHLGLKAPPTVCPMSVCPSPSLAGKVARGGGVWGVWVGCS